MTLTRRSFTRLALALACAVGAGCSRAGSTEAPEVVLYTSADDYLVREVVARFEAETGIRVRVAGDTEATKTTGLVQRVIAEQGRPGADVWWSSEALGTLRLREEGLLEPLEPGWVPPDWPAGLAAPDRTWAGFALRARVIAVSTDRVADADRPATLDDLADPRFRGRIGMARPEFGTTRGHVAALVAYRGEEAFGSWLAALKANGLRLYDSNSAIVRAIAQGEIDVGLTDTDDVWAAQREGWKVGAVFETPARGGMGPLGWDRGAILIPNTIARVRAGPNPGPAQRLIAYLLSAEVERLLAASDSHNIPVRAEPGGVFAPFAPPPGSTVGVDWEKVHRAVPAALRICGDVLGA